MNTNYFLRKNDKNGKIYFLFQINGKKVKVSTGLNCAVADWSKGEPKKRSNTSDLRKWLTHYQQQIDTFIQETIATEHRTPTKAELKEKCFEVTGQKSEESQSIPVVIERYLLLKEKKVLPNTIKQVKTHLNYFSNYFNNKTLTDLNKKELNRLKDSLESQSFEIQTLNSYIKDIKVFLSWLHEKEYTETNLAVDLKKEKQPEKEVIALTESEVEQLEQFHFMPRLQRVVDLFLFSCYTALRVSDLKQFDSDKIQNGYYHFRQYKTSGKIKLPLIPEAIEILEKYNYQLPTISEQKGNEYIKEAFALAQIDRLVTTTSTKEKRPVDTLVPLHTVASWHLARRSFVSIAISKGIPVNAVMAVTGHSDYQTMKKYLRMNEKNVAEQMKNTFSRRGNQMRAI